MNYLLDSHTFLWYVDGNPKLPRRNVEVISNHHNRVFLSFASIWEMGIKNALGKLNFPDDFSTFIHTTLRSKRIHSLEIKMEHIFTAVNFPIHHRDPFDRLLAAQSKIENLPVISNDTMLDKYGIEMVW
jgi:PIN domain nuclease of toxin-antitoxin system